MTPYFAPISTPKGSAQPSGAIPLPRRYSKASSDDLNHDYATLHTNHNLHPAASVACLASPTAPTTPAVCWPHHSMSIGQPELRVAEVAAVRAG
jgi:hypothetical protein